MSDYLDFTPTVYGQPVDPEGTGVGGSVSADIQVFDDPNRSTAIEDVSATVTRIMPFVYRFTFDPPLPPSRYWTTITWTADDSSPEQTSSGRVDFPTDPTMMCSVEDVAVRLGVTLPVTAAQRETISDRIREAQADVAAYLNRPLTATAQTLHGVWPTPPFDLTDYRAWPVGHFDDTVEVIGATLNDEDTYDVSLLVGLDGPREPSIVRYVTAHAVEMLRVDPSAGMGQKIVTSVSADGQSVSYAGVSNATMTANAGQPGAFPNIKTLSGLRRIAVYRRRTAPRQPWPYDFQTMLYRTV